MNAVSTPIQASVNEKKFFSSMKHSFASSFSIIPEMMQNSRRAGATKVEFTFNPDTKTLVVSDDGEGIDNFAVLLSLCDSGWDQSTMQADNPFGMGFFSLFFACEEVQVESNGKKLNIRIADIENKTVLTTTATEHCHGTKITLNALCVKLLGKCPYDKVYTMYSEVKEAAKGFPIEVIFNGEHQARPHAKSALTGSETEYGFFSINGIVNDSYLPSDFHMALYLQGLPIQLNMRTPNIVVHLDGKYFTPVLPDRKHLYNSGEALLEIKQKVKALIVEFLQSEKNRLSHYDFATKYWNAAIQHSKILLNDVGYMHKDLITYIRDITYDNMFESKYSGFQTMEKILSENNTFRSPPENIYDEENNGAILRMLQAMDATIIDTHLLDKDHWANAVPSLIGAETSVDAAPTMGEYSYYIERYWVGIKLVKSFKIKMTTPNGLQFAKEFTNDWVVTAKNDEELTCYVCEKGESNLPDALTNFLDENDNFSERYRDESIFEWDAIISGLRGHTLTQTIKDQLRKIHVPIVEKQVGQMTLLHASNQKHSICLEVQDLEDATFWDRMHENLKGKTITALEIKAAFTAAKG